VTARHRDRGGIDDLALDLGRFQQTVDPEAVPAGLLDHHEPQRSAQLVLSLVLDLRQQGEQGRAVTPGHGVLGNLLAAGQVDPDQPSRPAQFKGNADRCLLGLDGGRDKGGGVTGHHWPPGLAPRDFSLPVLGRYSPAWYL
jgi:hypothetical protein